MYIFLVLVCALYHHYLCVYPITFSPFLCLLCLLCPMFFFSMTLLFLDKLDRGWDVAVDYGNNGCYMCMGM